MCISLQDERALAKMIVRGMAADPTPHATTGVVIALTVEVGDDAIPGR
jgi:hypothetical protein